MARVESYERGELLFRKEGTIASIVDAGDYWDVTLESPDPLANGSQFSVKKQEMPELQKEHKVTVYTDQKFQGKMTKLEIDGVEVRI